MIVSQYTITHPFLCEMIKILLTSTSTTGPLESSYSKLYYKDRNKVFIKNLEILYLLSSLKRYVFDYNGTFIQMEK